MKTLITGSSSGLGKYLAETVAENNPFGLHEIVKYKRGREFEDEVNTIIHCAWDTQGQDAVDYVGSAIALVDKLTDIPHKQFIFISTIDVYSKSSILNIINHDAYKEENTDIRNITGLYALTKFIVESYILEWATNPIIIRPGILLGKYTRKNSTVVNLIRGKDIQLSSNSHHYYTLYKDILKVIKYAESNHLNGVFNVIGNESVTLKDILPKSTKVGSFTYDAGYISNEKICKLIPSLNQTSREKFETWKTTFIQEK